MEKAVCDAIKTGSTVIMGGFNYSDVDWVIYAEPILQRQGLKVGP